MVTASCPRHIVLAGRGLNYAGSGRAPGSHAYVDPGRGEVVEVFFGKVVSTGAAFGLCAVANNTAIPAIRVDNGLVDRAGPLRLGQILMMAVKFESKGPRATAIWPITSRPAAKPATVEKLGTVTSVKTGFLFIRPADGTADAHAFFSDCQFTPFVGASVRYTASSGPRGPKARNVRLS